MARKRPTTGVEAWSDNDFEAVARFLKEELHVELAAHRLALLRARLQTHLIQVGEPCFSTFFVQIQQGGKQGSASQLLIDLSTINHTSFFREPTSLNFLADRLAEKLRGGQTVARVWSAGSSTGEEPYSLAMLISERLDGLIARRLECWASDLSLGVLRRAAKAMYDARLLNGVAEDRVRRFFLKGRGPRAGSFRIAPEIRSLVTFHHLDLRRSLWDVPAEFDAILCRNVLIYFEESERARMVDRFAERLIDGGWFVVGQGEIVPERPGVLKRLAPAIFRKV